MTRLFSKVLLSFFFITGIIIATDTQADQELTTSPKIVYAKALSTTQTLQDQTFYVGQEISIVYEASLFAEASLKGSNFEKNSKGVELKNKNATWKSVDSQRLQTTYVFKLKASSATIPALNVVALSADGSYEDTMRVDSIVLNVIDLKSNTQYAGFLGKDFKLLRHKSQNYDEFHNIIVFEFETQAQNLEDMKIQGFETQGFEELSQRNGGMYGVYYVIVPKSLRELSFEYFNPEVRRFESVNIPIVVVNSELVSTQSDLNPKASYAFFKLVIIGVLIIFFLGLFLWKRYKIFLFIVALLCGILIYTLAFSNSYGTLKSGALVSILPMKDSTIVRVVESDMPIQIVGERKMDLQGQSVLLYKVIIGDSQIGWVRSEYVSKN